MIFDIPDNKYKLDERDWIFDCETDDLVDYKNLWCLVFRNYATDEVKVFRNVEAISSEAAAWCHSNVRYYIGHNVISFDAGVLKKFLGIDLTPENTLDTLVLSRLFKTNRPGGHSLENWGKIVGKTKSAFSDFSQYSQELEDRCIGDTDTNRRMLHLFNTQLLTKRWQLPIYLENTIEFFDRDIKSYGFYYNIEYHKILLEELKRKTLELEEEFKSVFNSDFNPRSPKQRVEVLNAAGWKPTVKTKGHIAERRKGKGADPEKLAKYAVYGWTCDAENLETLPDTAPPAARKLTEYLLLSSRLGDLEEWERAYNPDTKAIHPTITGLGGWTHRRSHQKPNSANIPALISRKGTPQPYGKEMRSLWRARPGTKLVGTDAAGIQLRIFAHYCQDQRLIDAVVNGRKEDGTDIHTVNKKALGDVCKGREPAKTYIYAKFLGASLPKVAEILSCTIPEADAADKRIMKFYPGWEKLKKSQIKKDAERGYFIGLDGRLVFHPGEHYVLAGYLQNGESVIMKMANVLWKEEINRLGLSSVVHQVNDVHDEWQTEVLDQDALPARVGALQVKAIEQVGEILKLNCPLTGEFKIGDNWAETH